MSDQSADLENGTVVRCPACGSFVVREKFEGVAELNCSQSKCKAAMIVAVRDGQVAVTLIDKPVVRRT